MKQKSPINTNHTTSWRTRLLKLTKTQRGLLVAAVLAVAGVLFIWNSLAAVNPNLQGDLNSDNKVTVADLSILLSNFGKTGSTADMNGDAKVTVADLSVLLTNFNKTYTPGGTTPPTPPPTTPPPTTPPSGSNPYLAPGISKGIINDATESTAADAADMKTLGAKWNRGWLSCGGASGISAAVKRMSDNGITYLPSYNCNINTSIADYKAKLAADMKVLTPMGIHVWEIGNEMDGGWTAENNYCGNNSTPGNMQCAERAYTPYLKAAYETVHANDPQGVVVYGGLSSYDVNLGPWMTSMMANPDKPWQYMDGFGFHPYGNSVDESMASMDVVKSYMAKDATFATKPIWITEFGCWSSGLGSQQNSPCSPQNEAGKSAYLKTMFDRLKVWNKGTSFEIRTPICWYILHEQGGSGAAGYGLKTGSGSGGHLDAFTAFQNYVF